MKIKIKQTATKNSNNTIQNSQNAAIQLKQVKVKGLIESKKATVNYVRIRLGSITTPSTLKIRVVQRV